MPLLLAEGSYHPGKYADGAVGFVPAMFKEGFVISERKRKKKYRAGYVFKVCSFTFLTDIFFTFVQVHAG